MDPRLANMTYETRLPETRFPRDTAVDVSGLEAILAAAARMLPAQGSITTFIHHNTLHAFEHLPFETAVVEAARLLGTQPYLDEGWYRQQLARGRIRPQDVDAVLDESGPHPDAPRLAGDRLHRSRLGDVRRWLAFGVSFGIVARVRAGPARLPGRCSCIACVCWLISHRTMYGRSMAATCSNSNRPRFSSVGSNAAGC